MYNDFNIQPTMCKICKRQASKIEEYIQLAKECGYATVDECVENEEGTFNPDTRKFYQNRSTFGNSIRFTNIFLLTMEKPPRFYNRIKFGGFLFF